MSFKFPDVSRWQGNIDWDVVKVHADENNIKTVLIKVTGSDGGLYVDSKAARNIAEARRVGLPCAFYVYKGDSNPTDTAKHLLAAIGTFQKGEFVVSDDENEGTVNVGWNAEFVDYIKSQLNIVAPVYSNLNRFRNLDLSPLKDRGVKAHVASYGTNDGNPHTAPSGIDMDIIAWQYTSVARIPGITENTVDMNIFNGELADWMNLGLQGSGTIDVQANYVAPFQQATGDGYYTVKQGDVGLIQIAQDLGIADWRTIAATNGLVAPYVIHVGDRLRVFGGTLGQAALTADVASGLYVVVKDDNLIGIGAKTGHDWHEIAKLNNIAAPNYTIFPGQRLQLPGGGVSQTAQTEATYTVRQSDSDGLAAAMARIGRSDWQAVAKLNNKSAPYIIYPNEVLRLP